MTSCAASRTGSTAFSCSRGASYQFLDCFKSPPVSDHAFPTCESRNWSTSHSLCPRTPLAIRIAVSRLRLGTISYCSCCLSYLPRSLTPPLNLLLSTLATSTLSSVYPPITSEEPHCCTLGSWLLCLFGEWSLRHHFFSSLTSYASC